MIGEDGSTGEGFISSFSDGIERVISTGIGIGVSVGASFTVTFIDVISSIDSGFNVDTVCACA